MAPALETLMQYSQEQGYQGVKCRLRIVHSQRRAIVGEESIALPLNQGDNASGVTFDLLILLA